MSAIRRLVRRLLPAERKSLAAPEPWLQSIFGVPTSAGVTISIEDALRVPACQSAIRVISDAAAALTIEVREVRADGAETAIPGHPSLRFLQGDANPWTSGHELIRDLLAEALIQDIGGLAVVSRTFDGRPMEIIRYSSGAIGVDVDRVTGEPRYRRENGAAIPTSDVVHVRSPLARAPLSLAREAIATSAVMASHAAGLFSRGAKPSGVLSFAKGMGDEAVKRAIAGWRAAQEGPDNAGKTAILYDGATWAQMGLTSTDAQFLENRKFQILEIARAFRVPPSMLYELDRATWSNTEQMGREFLVYSLEPWLQIMETSLARALFTEEERKRLRFRFDRDDLTRADLQTRATTINSLIASRVISPNEGRAWLGLEPREGGDEFLNPNITADPAKAENPAPAPEDEPEDTDGPE